LAGWRQACHDAQQRRLAAAGRADDAPELPPRRDGEAEVVADRRGLLT
jgi:hypothetical protein